MIYKVAITETLRKIVAVEAMSSSEAHQRVMDAWKASEIILTADNFEGVEVYVSGELRNIGDKQIIERKD